SIHWCSTQPIDGRVMAVIGPGGAPSLSVAHIDLRRNTADVVPLQLDQGWNGICGHGGALFVIRSGDRLQVFNEQDGQLLGRLDLPSNCVWVGGRFVRRGPAGPWMALSYNGTAAQFETVLGESSKRCPKLLKLF